MELVMRRIWWERLAKNIKGKIWNASAAIFGSGSDWCLSLRIREDLWASYKDVKIRDNLSEG